MIGRQGSKRFDPSEWGRHRGECLLGLQDREPRSFFFSK